MLITLLGTAALWLLTDSQAAYRLNQYTGKLDYFEPGNASLTIAVGSTLYAGTIPIVSSTNTMTNSKYCIFTTSVGIVCDSTVAEPTKVIAGFTITNGDTAIDDTVVDPVACLRIPVSSTITAWYIDCDKSGNIVLDVWKNTWNDTPEVSGDSIAGTEKPTLAGDVSSSDVALGSMTTDWNANDNVCIEIESAATVTKCRVQFLGVND